MDEIELTIINLITAIQKSSEIDTFKKLAISIALGTVLEILKDNKKLQDLTDAVEEAFSAVNHIKIGIMKNPQGKESL